MFETKCAQVDTRPVSLILLFAREAFDAAFHIKRNISKTGRVSTGVLFVSNCHSFIFFLYIQLILLVNSQHIRRTCSSSMTFLF